MLILHCPNCRVDSDETELHCGGQAHISRPGIDASDTEFENYMFIRKNPRGVHFERWHHTYGCGKWFHVARCTATLRVFATYSAQTYVPPEMVITQIKKQVAGFKNFAVKGSQS